MIQRNGVDRGQSLVEFALVLPLLIALLVGILDVGRAVFAYHTVNNAAREAGRMATVAQVDEKVVNCAIEQGIALELTDENVAIEYRPLAPEAPISVAVVTVTYDFEPVLPFIADLAAFFSREADQAPGDKFGPFTFTGVNQSPIEITCTDPASCPPRSLPEDGSEPPAC